MFSTVMDDLPEIRATKTKSVSIFRTTGTSRLVREGCDRPSLLNWGRWSDQTTADGSYINKEPLSALGANSILAGWGKLDAAQTSHDLGRGSVEPPSAWVDAVTTAANGRTAREIVADLKQHNHKCFSEGRANDRNLDGVSCLEAVLHLVKVFWQDQAIRGAARAGTGSVPASSRLPTVCAITDTKRLSVLGCQGAGGTCPIRQPARDNCGICGSQHGSGSRNQSGARCFGQAARVSGA